MATFYHLFGEWKGGLGDICTRENMCSGSTAKARGAKVRRVLPLGHPPGCSLGVPRPAGDLARVTRLQDIWPAPRYLALQTLKNLLFFMISG